LNDELDEEYHVSILDVKTRKIIGKEEKFQTLEEVLGFLHKFEEGETIRERMFVCLMGLRDGVSEVIIHRKTFHVGNQILRIKPPKGFHKLFWEGTGEFKE
jgi:hypothetical protein